MPDGSSSAAPVIRPVTVPNVIALARNRVFVLFREEGKRIQVFCWPRFAKKISLAFSAASLLHVVQFFLALDPFCGCFHSQVCC
jgi:hypothetical protein